MLVSIHPNLFTQILLYKHQQHELQTATQRLNNVLNKLYFEIGITRQKWFGRLHDVGEEREEPSKNRRRRRRSRSSKKKDQNTEPAVTS